MPWVPEALVGLGLPAFARAKVAPMVRGWRLSAGA